MVITVAMKLPVDLNDEMPGLVDQFAKLVSMPFMSTMIANLMPSLASMDDKKLSENVIGLLILIVTVVVNVAIQIQTGVLDRLVITYVYLGQMLYVLIVLISLALAARASKQILEIKYQAANKTASKDIHLAHTRMSTVEELIQCVRRYYIMAGTCNPQFVMATNPLCSAAGIICISNTVTFFYYVISMFLGKRSEIYSDHSSEYKWSMLVIFLTQSVGIVVGTISPLFRCFAPLTFKLSLKWCKKHTQIFKVEKYWIKKLSEWKEVDLVFSFDGHILKALVHHLNHLVVYFCIGFQKVVVVSCKTLALIPIGVVVIGVYCVHCWKSIKKAFFATSMVPNHDSIVYEREPSDVDEDIRNYVLRLDNEMELGTRTLRRISKSVDPLIHKAEKESPKNLMELVERFTGFGGVLSFDSDEVQSLLSVELPNSWSLAVVTLTCFAITLPNVCKDLVDSLFNSVCEGLLYTSIVEESLNNMDEAKSIQTAAKILWHEVEFEHTWLGYTLQGNDFKEKSPIEILKWFSSKAEEMVVEINKSNNDEMLEISRDRLIAANSMYRITKTILLKCHGDEDVSEEQLFALIFYMIVSIMVACLTNIPRVIAIKCYGSRIEEREASVEAAANILGSTKKIIERLQMCELPSLKPHQMTLIDEWHVYLKQEIP